jgi:hypothetical protein
MRVTFWSFITGELDVLFPGYGGTDETDSEYARTEECWTLPPADKCFDSSTALTFIYANPPIVVKIFLEPGCYEQERKAYEKLTSLSCPKSFPVLYASGRVVDNEQPFLILSNEGERVDTVTESDK